MLEVRFIKSTKELTGWWGSRFGNHPAKLKNRPDEAMVTLNIGIPEKPLGAYLIQNPDTNPMLIPNPSYVEPPAPRDVEKEVDDLKKRLEKLEKPR